MKSIHLEFYITSVPVPRFRKDQLVFSSVISLEKKTVATDYNTLLIALRWRTSVA